jgi:hypothetical protein
MRLLAARHAGDREAYAAAKAAFRRAVRASPARQRATVGRNR